MQLKYEARLDQEQLINSELNSRIRKLEENDTLEFEVFSSGNKKTIKSRSRQKSNARTTKLNFTAGDFRCKQNF